MEDQQDPAGAQSPEQAAEPPVEFNRGDQVQLRIREFSRDRTLLCTVKRFEQPDTLVLELNSGQPCNSTRGAPAP